MTESRKTSLYENHKKLGAKLIPFSGFLMPLQYSSIIEEHKHVRSMAGIFDVSHMGEFLVKGDKVKFTVKFKGREMQHIQLGKDLMNRIIEDTKDIAKIETQPKFEGRQMIMIIQPN